MSSLPASEVEAALVGLIAELEKGGFEEATREAGERANRAIAAATPGSLAPDAQERVKRLHALALSQLQSRRDEIETEMKRVAEARQLLKSCMRPDSGGATGKDLNISG